MQAKEYSRFHWTDEIRLLSNKFFSSQYETVFFSCLRLCYDDELQRPLHCCCINTLQFVQWNRKCPLLGRTFIFSLTAVMYWMECFLINVDSRHNQLAFVRTLSTTNAIPCEPMDADESIVMTGCEWEPNLTVTIMMCVGANWNVEQSLKAPAIQDDADGHLIYRTGDILHNRCSWKICEIYYKIVQYYISISLHEANISSIALDFL